MVTSCHKKHIVGLQLSQKYLLIAINKHTFLRNQQQTQILQILNILLTYPTKC